MERHINVLNTVSVPKEVVLKELKEGRNRKDQALALLKKKIMSNKL